MSWERAKTYLQDVANELGIGIELLTAQQAQSLRDRASRRFSDRTSNGITTENLVDCARLSRDNSWQYIESFEFVGPVILFTNLRDGESMFKFSSIRDAMAVLKEAPPFDFYLIDQDCSFLLAHNEYDTLFGCGAAKPFVESL